MTDRLTRRTTLARGAGFLAAALGLGAWRLDLARDPTPSPACSPRSRRRAPYIDAAKLRRDIRAGRPGRPMTLRLTVVDAATCRPIKGAAVDVWHCDAGGAYSGFDDPPAESFLRGIQRTDAKGVAAFRTIYPGWYPGRAVHIHVKVHVARRRRPHRAAVFPGPRHRRRPPEQAVQRARPEDDAERGRRRLPQRRKPLAPPPAQERRGRLPRHADDGRQDLVRHPSSAIASSFVTVFQLRAVATTPRSLADSTFASLDLFMPLGCQA